MNTNAIVNYATAAISAAALFCALVPKPKPGSLWSNVYGLIEVLGANVGNAKSVSPTSPPE